MSLQFSPKDPAEVVVLSFNFVNLLASGEIILSVTFSVTDQNGNINTSSAMLSGVADLSESPVIKQAVQGGLDGHTYLIRATATTSLNQTLVGGATLAVSFGS